MDGEIERGGGGVVRGRERERDGGSLQRPARSLPGPNARQLIPGCFPFPAGGAFPATLKMLSPSLHLSAPHTDPRYCALLSVCTYRPVSDAVQ